MDNGFNPIINDGVIHFNPTFSTNTHGFKPGGDDPEPMSNDYEKLIHKPKINGKTLVGDLSDKDLGIESAIQSISQNGVEKEIVDKNVNIVAPEEELTMIEMQEIWKQWFK